MTNAVYKGWHIFALQHFSIWIMRANSTLHMTLHMNALQPATLKVLFIGTQVDQCLFKTMK